MASSDEAAASRLSRKHGTVERCPHCGNVAAVEPSAGLRFRCQICGGPRVVIDAPGIVRSGREIPALKAAQHQRFRIAAWRVGAGALAGLSMISLLVVLTVLLLVSPGVAGTLTALSLVAVPVVLAAVLWSKAARRRAEQQTALDEAWSLAARDALEQRGEELSAADLARIMHLRDDEAEQLLADLSLNDHVRSRVTDGGDVLYSAGALKPRMRIDADTHRGQAAEQPPGDETDESSASMRT